MVMLYRSSTTAAVSGGRRRGRQPRKNLESFLTSEGTEVAVTSTTLPCTDSFRVYRSGGGEYDYHIVLVLCFEYTCNVFKKKKHKQIIN